MVINWEKVSPTPDDRTGRDFLYVLADIDWESQLWAIRSALNMLNKNALERKEFIESEEQHVRDSPLSGEAHERLQDGLIGKFDQQVFNEATRSMATIALIVPTLESIFKIIFRNLGEMYERNKHPYSQHKRWIITKNRKYIKNRWNCEFHYCCKKTQSRGIAKGISELCDASDLNKYLDPEIMEWISMLFQYRNKMLHGGFEWDQQRKQELDDEIAKKGWSKHFSRSTTDGETWMIYLSDQAIKDIIPNLEKLLDSIALFAKDLPFELTRDPEL